MVKLRVDQAHPTKHASRRVELTLSSEPSNTPPLKHDADNRVMKAIFIAYE